MRGKSDSQLDAEAAAPPPPLELNRHRATYYLETYISRLTTETPPVTIDPQTGKQSADDMSMLGPTLTARLERYVTGAYGVIFPWARAYRALGVDCRRNHDAHTDRMPEGSLCQLLVRRVVIDGWHPDRVSVHYQLDPERTEKVLRRALHYIDARYLEYLWRAEQREGQYEELPEHRHHAVPGLHELDCHNRECRSSAA